MNAILAALGRLSHVAPRTVAWICYRLMLLPRRRRLPRTASEGATLHTSSGLVVRSWGHSGPVVLCLHGWEGCARQFDYLASQLAARGMRVLALDARSHGDSPAGAITPLDFLPALRELHAMSEAPPLLLGHSLGAAIVMLALREGLPFSRCVLIAGPVHFGAVFARFDRLVKLAPRARAALEHRLEQRLGLKLDQLDLVAAPPPGTALLIHDEDDKEVPFSDTRTLAQAWPAAGFMPTRGHGHQRILRDDAVARAIGDYFCAA